MGISARTIFLFFATVCLAACEASCADPVSICYYNADSITRSGAGSFGVTDLPLNLCTHFIYSFIGMTADGGIQILNTEQTLEGKSNTLKDFTALKSNSTSKFMVAIGGWNEASTNFTIVVNNDTLRATFVSNAMSFLKNYSLDGLDLDWEYPAQRGGVDADKETFITLIKDLKAAFEPEGYILTAAVAVTQSHIDLSYNVTGMNEYLDYINLMCYDYHGTWDTVTGVNAPLFAQLTDSNTTNLNVNASVNVWIENGASPSKLVLGLPNYGKTFTLASLNNTSTGAPFTAGGVGGPYLNESGNWAFFEICEDQQNNPESWNITTVDGNYVYANKDLFWVGYENTDTIYAKGQYAKSMGLAGVMYWSVDLDDFGGVCGSKFPLITQGIAGYNAV